MRTADRSSGIKKAIDLLGINPVAGKDALRKPNFNTADPFPGSTHNDTLTHLILQHKAMGAAGITIAGTDRIAIDAVGIAILKDLGSNSAIMGKRIFEQEQISRAVELGLGVSRPQDIELIADDARGNEYAGRLREVLDEG